MKILLIFEFLQHKNVWKKSNEKENDFMIRYTHWGDRSPTCQGYYEHGLCVFGVGDLKWLHKMPELFAHKFHHTVQPIAYDCMEEWMFNRTWNLEKS